ncbi:pimeloyl-ACP methyl ester carboxylesterase [Actinomadura pelletieri DSM 43383]|uniref:Pimeloyl-ACP methyl ester carboxylesterase n=1 Tax=Actinomadura pelletieri DSM 43383 TaxID=1120940 RepID=A0A495QI94_9ACTN|nr:alpha/beta hydrolase [Actinomadura pelletieri]RKS71858.1 pimeloyl-ACP methyl ester carboxylesterase [Actinomadura pelletieri DSM 43383]
MTTVSSTLRVPDGRLHYEVRGRGPLVALVGSPMGAAAFEPLADLLADGFTVLTTDPRGINRSPLDDPAQDSTPELRADDLARLIGHVDAGPAVAFGSSGGACTVLALAQAHGEHVRAVIAHEPPLVELLDDRDAQHKKTDELIGTYLGGDVLGAWGMFMEQANIQLPPGALEHMFGGERDLQQIADERRWFEHELRETTRWRPDLDALGKAHVIVGIGEDSAGELCDRTSRVLAGALGADLVMFPGGHTGFEEDPETFAVRLRPVLDAIE